MNNTRPTYRDKLVWNSPEDKIRQGAIFHLNDDRLVHVSIIKDWSVQYDHTLQWRQMSTRVSIIIGNSTVDSTVFSTTLSMLWITLNYGTYVGDSLTHWGRVTHICVSKLTIIGSDNGLSPGRRQAIIWTNAGLLSIRLLETNFSEILIKIDTFSFKKMRLKMSSGKRRPFCLGLNVLKEPVILIPFQYAMLSWNVLIYSTRITWYRLYSCVIRLARFCDQTI